MDKMPLPNSNKSLTERRIVKGSRLSPREVASHALTLLIGFAIGGVTFTIF